MTEPIEHFRTLLSWSATWQTLCGATGTDAAKRATAAGKVHLWGYDNEDEMTAADLPLAVLTIGSDDRRAEGTSQYAPSGVIEFALWIGGLSGTWNAQRGTLDAYLRAIVSEMTALAGTVSGSTSFLVVRSLDISEPELSAEADTAGEYWVCPGSCAWGMG